MWNNHINNLKYGDDTMLMADSGRITKEPLDKGERREWKADLKLNI